MKTSAQLSGSAQSFPAPQQRRSARAGFTLLETMVALALCGLIIAALGTATHLYWKYRTLTKGQIHTAHLVRGLTEDFSEVLRSVTPLWLPEPGDDAELLVTRDHNDSANDFSNDLSQANLQFISVLESVPFAGTSHLFAVLTEHPSARFSHSDKPSNVSGPMHVVWWINDGSTNRISLLRKGNSRESVELPAGDVSKGLIRSMISTEISATNRGQSIDSQLISGDVRAMSLKYFDGTSWTTDWSTRGIHEIPLLVEFSISFTDEVSGGTKQAAVFVVAIPQGTNR